MHNFDHLTEQDIAKRFTRHKATAIDASNPEEDIIYRDAGVLVPFIKAEGSWHILYIRRAELEGDRYSGQVAFPGGKQEKQDKDMRATALREAHEEVGVAPEDVRVLGQLGYHYSASSFRITPVAGVINWPYPLKLQETEVSRAFTIPLQWLADPQNHEIRAWKAPDQQQSYDVAYFKEYDGELLWGATAKMTLSLLQLLRS